MLNKKIAKAFSQNILDALAQTKYNEKWKCEGNLKVFIQQQQKKAKK